MKRSSFLKSLIGIYGLTYIPLETIKQYEKVYIKQCFVRGFQYYDGRKLINEINTSEQFELVREPDNKYYNHAISIHFNGHKIGYIPRESNKTISILMDTELLEFHAEITHVNAEVEYWEQLRVAVYALKEIKHANDLKKIQPYTILHTPHYHSVKSDNNTLTKIHIEDNAPQLTIEDAGVFLLKRIDCVYFEEPISVLFYSHDSIKELEQCLETDNLLRYTSSLPQAVDEKNLSDELGFAYLNSELIEKSGIFAVNIHKLYDESYRISGLTHVIGKNSIDFFEVNFEVIEA